ncbi:MAG: YjjG family noncanonical pyrimidine nucleotidase [Oscillospiraceae bacterium]|nr:YjjG family noncanonical pyrimidine nucleotidase [Oscillospiraceae bacterium]
MYKAILWDIDGTLLNFIKSENAAIKECFRHFALPECTDEMVAVYSEINEGYWKLLERGEITKPELFTQRFRDFFEKIGVSCNEAEFNSLYQQTLGKHIFPNDNGIELVRSLKGRVHQYAVTNGSAVAQERKLRVSGLDRLLDGIFISDKIGAEKPSVNFFDCVFQQIPEGRGEVIVIGDSLTSDIRGANNAGIACCWYSPEHSTPPADLRIDYIITDLNQIKNII